MKIIRILISLVGIAIGIIISQSLESGKPLLSILVLIVGVGLIFTINNRLDSVS